jgi:hypothetical protein
VRRLALALLLVAVTTAAVAWPAISRRASEAASSSAPQGSPADPDWSAVVRALDRDRHAVLAGGEEADLAAVYARGSPAGQRDLASLRRFAAAGLRPRGLRLGVLSAQPVAFDRDRAMLRVVDSLPGYDLVNRAGAVVRRYPGRGPVAWRLTLVRTAAGWRIYDVTRLTRDGSGRR